MLKKPIPQLARLIKVQFFWTGNKNLKLTWKQSARFSKVFVAFSEHLNFWWDKSENIHLKEPKNYFLAPVFWQDFLKNLCEGALDFRKLFFSIFSLLYFITILRRISSDRSNNCPNLKSTLKSPKRNLLKAPYIYFKRSDFT